MNILVAINRNYIAKLKVLLESIFTNNSIEVEVYLLHSELLENDIEGLQLFCKTKSKQNGILRDINAICVNRDIFDNVKINIPGLSIETYYRLLATELLPDQIDRILYLDVDIVVDGSLDEFYNVNFENKAAAVCADTIANFKDDIRTRIGLSKEGTYFNAGVILFNMSVWRTTVSINTVADIINSGRHFPFHDQDILNILLDGNLLYVNSFLYNFEVVLARDYVSFYNNIVKPLKLKPIIYHYAGDHAAKPWNESYNCADFNKYYWKYAGMLFEQIKQNCQNCEQLQALHKEINSKENRVRKFKKYFDVNNDWLKLIYQGWHFEDYFNQKGYKDIAIYGLGEFGKRLCEALTNTNIHIVYSIDQKVIQSEKIIIKSIYDELPPVDVVVVTPIIDFDKISAILEEKHTCPIISIEEVIEYAHSNPIMEYEDIISVIVPLYNGLNYVDGIIKMLENNAKNCKKYQIELIFVNDYPADELNYGKALSNDLQITIINHSENKGTHASRVDGLEIASGNYIVFLDQDDIFKDDYFKCQVPYLSGADAVICNGYMSDREYEGMIYPKFGLIESCMDEWIYLLCDNRIVSPGQVMLKKSSIPNCWKKYILKKNGVDDYFLWISMFECNAKFTVNNSALFIHTYNGNNISNDYKKMGDAMSEFIELLSTKNDIFYSQEMKNLFIEIYSYHKLAREKMWNLFDEDIDQYKEIHKLINDMRKKIQFGNSYE